MNAQIVIKSYLNSFYVSIKDLNGHTFFMSMGNRQYIEKAIEQALIDYNIAIVTSKFIGLKLNACKSCVHFKFQRQRYHLCAVKPEFLRTISRCTAIDDYYGEAYRMISFIEKYKELESINFKPKEIKEEIVIFESQKKADLDYSDKILM